MKYIVLFQHLQLKNIGLVLLCSFMFSNLLYSQSTREVINFDHGWLFNRYGLQPDGKRIDEPFGNGSPDSPSPKELAFNDKDWRKLDVPHDWGIEGPFRENLDGYTGKLPWRGIGWYRKRFNIKNIDKDKMFFLDFDGVMANAEVYLNGKKIGERPYGYISFRVNLTPYIRFDSENIIRRNWVLVGIPEQVFTGMSDWSKPTSFIFPNGVYLFLRPKSIANMPPHP